MPDNALSDKRLRRAVEAQERASVEPKRTGLGNQDTRRRVLAAAAKEGRAELFARQVKRANKTQTEQLKRAAEKRAAAQSTDSNQ